MIFSDINLWMIGLQNSKIEIAETFNLTPKNRRMCFFFFFFFLLLFLGALLLNHFMLVNIL